MNNTVIKVLAVADPAVAVYVDTKHNILKNFGTVVQFDIVPWEAYYKTMLEVFDNKAHYDVIMIAGHLWLRDFAKKGYLAAIELEAEDILPTILQEMSYEGTTYLSPSFCDGHMIAYRKSIMKEKYGRLPGNVITPEEYIQIAKCLGEGNERKAIVMKAHSSEIFTDALPFLRMQGRDVYATDTLAATCNNPEVIQGLEAYLELRQYAPSDTDTYGNEQVVEAIQKKQAAMAITWSGQLGVVYNEECEEREDLGFATLETAWNVTWSFAISANSRKKEEAQELLRFLRSPEVDKLAGGCSGAPVRRGSYIEGRAQYPWYECQLNMIEHAKPLPNISGAGDKNGVLYEEIANAFAGRKSAREAMADAEYRINSMD